MSPRAKLLQRRQALPRSCAPKAPRGFIPLILQMCSQIMAPLCDAVAFLHSKGVAHRDIKPENVVMFAGAPSTMPGALQHVPHVRHTFATGGNFSCAASPLHVSSARFQSAASRAASADTDGAGIVSETSQSGE